MITIPVAAVASTSRRILSALAGVAVAITVVRFGVAPAPDDEPWAGFAG